MPMTGSESSRWRVKQLIRSNQQSETQGYSIYSERPQRKQQISGMFGRFTGFKLPFHYHNCLFEQYSHLRSWKHCFVLLFVIGSVLDVPLKAAVQPLLELDRVFKKKNTTPNIWFWCQSLRIKATASLLPGQQTEINPEIEKLNYSPTLASADLNTAQSQDSYVEALS